MSPHGEQRRLTAPDIRARKGGDPIVALTSYHAHTARLLDKHCDVILVGDSLAMVVLGYENTLPITVDEMLHHTRAVRRGVKRALVIADMPFASYQVDEKQAVKNAARFLKDGGAEAVKIEGGEKRVSLVHRLLDAEVPIMGHIGLTPQSVHMMGGYRVQGRGEEGERLLHDAKVLQAAGAFSVVLECVPAPLASLVTRELSISTIGIGAGPGCDAQVLVWQDMAGLSPRVAKFVKKYADVATVLSDAATAFAEDVTSGVFPDDAHSYK